MRDGLQVNEILFLFGRVQGLAYLVTARGTKFDSHLGLTFHIYLSIFYKIEGLYNLPGVEGCCFDSETITSSCLAFERLQQKEDCNI